MKNLSAGNALGALRRNLSLIVLGIVLAGSAVSAEAAPKRISCESDPECVRLRNEGQRMYEADNFQMALSALISAYVIQADPVLLLNMGLTLLGLGRHQEALERCQQFELRVPKRSEQENSHLALCKKNAERMAAESSAKAKEAEEARTKAAAASAAVEAAAAEKEKEARAQQARPVYKRAWFWGVIGGIVAAGVIVGVTAAVLTSPAHRTPADLEVFQVQLTTF